MAVFETTTMPVTGRAFGGRLSAVIHTLFAGVIAWNDARATHNALSKLTDRELDDIGLNRSDISSIR